MTRQQIIQAIDDAVDDHDCEVVDGCATCEGLNEAEDEMMQAETIIESLKRGACWCERSDGHSSVCIAAQRFMENKA